MATPFAASVLADSSALAAEGGERHYQYQLRLLGSTHAFEVSDVFDQALADRLYADIQLLAGLSKVPYSAFSENGIHGKPCLVIPRLGTAGFTLFYSTEEQVFRISHEWMLRYADAAKESAENEAKVPDLPERVKRLNESMQACAGDRVAFAKLMHSTSGAAVDIPESLLHPDSEVVFIGSLWDRRIRLDAERTPIFSMAVRNRKSRKFVDDSILLIDRGGELRFLVP